MSSLYTYTYHHGIGKEQVDDIIGKEKEIPSHFAVGQEATIQLNIPHCVEAV